VVFVKSFDSIGKMKLREMATILNVNGFKTSTGKVFGTTQVIRLLKKAG
jgi:hypothetical protein